MSDTGHRHRRRVLFVDDDPQFLATVKELMGQICGGEWEIETADGARDAFALLQNQPVDLAVLDLQMGVMDGVQMLALLNRGYPQVQKVILTGFPSEQNRAACLTHGAELFLEKPKTAADWHHLHVALSELLRVQPEAGFRGVMRRVGLPDVLQMECLARSSSVLEVMDHQQRGEIFVEAGRIIHAQVEGLQGEAAFNQLLSLNGGQFNLKPFEEPPARSIEGQWEFLLMEAARKKDEMAAEKAGGAVETNGADLGDEAVLPTHGDFTETLSSQEEAVAVAEGENNRLAPAVTQLLVCSSRGEILYEWQVRNAPAWISFIEFLSQRAQRLSHALGVGDFDELEVVSPPERLLFLLTPESGVLIRSELAPAVSGGGQPGVGETNRDALVAWQQATPPICGESLRAIQFPDNALFCQPPTSGLQRGGVDQAWRCVADTFHVLASNRITTDRLVWRFQKGRLDTVRMGETVFGVLTGPDSAEAEAEAGAIEALMEEFRVCGNSGSQSGFRATNGTERLTARRA